MPKRCRNTCAAGTYANIYPLMQETLELLAIAKAQLADIQTLVDALRERL